MMPGFTYPGSTLLTRCPSHFPRSKVMLREDLLLSRGVRRLCSSQLSEYLYRTRSPTRGTCVAVRHCHVPSSQPYYYEAHGIMQSNYRMLFQPRPASSRFCALCKTLETISVISHLCTKYICRDELFVLCSGLHQAEPTFQ